MIGLVLCLGCDQGRSYDETLSILKTESMVLVALEEESEANRKLLESETKLNEIQGAENRPGIDMVPELTAKQAEIESRLAKQQAICDKLQAELDAHRESL